MSAIDHRASTDLLGKLEILMVHDGRVNQARVGPHDVKKAIGEQ